MKSPISLQDSHGKIALLKKGFYYKRLSEKVELNESIGRELSETVIADSMSPETDIAAMDGYAVCSRDTYPLRLTGAVYAGDRVAKISNGECVTVATGAFMPEGADAVLKIEDAIVHKGTVSGKNLKKWENVFRRGSDYRPGDKIFEKNHRVMPQSAALLYSLGIVEVPVYKKLRAGIISTGTEIHNGMIKNTNAVLVQGFMKEFGCESTFIGTVPDDYDQTRDMLLRATEEYDLIITTGGVSVGERDFIADIIKETGEIIFHRVDIRPGKPLAVGIIKNKPVFALPGKPTGAFAALEIIIRKFFTDIPRATEEFTINENITLQDRDFNYILFVKTGKNTANTMGYKSSGLDLLKSEYDSSIISASPRSTIVNGYVITDKDIEKGEKVKVHLFS